MRMILLLLHLLLAWGEVSHANLMSQMDKEERRSERVLVRTKRRWVLTTIEMQEESSGPFPMKITKLFNEQQGKHSIRFGITGHGVTKDPKGAIGINEETGDVFMYMPIDREKYPIFHMEFDVYDANTGETLDNSLSFDVAIQDINDNPPLFTPRVLRVQVPENIKEGALPFSLQASDKDEEGNENSRISMTILSQQPALPAISLETIGNINDSMISKLLFTGCFDYDKARSYKLLVKAQDHGSPSLSSTTTVNIDITDSNTHPPVFIAPMYNAQVMEMETDKQILRIPVRDKDTPNTPGSRAVFTILKGNEDGNYKIETDPLTNEGLLTVIKAKDYEITTLTELEIGVENEEPLFVCVDGKPISPIPETFKRNSTTKVAVKVIDVNDPPVFKNKIEKIFRLEEDDPGEVLHTPIVTDEDSDPANIRYELVDDPAKWLSMNRKTGNISLVKRMDRESPYVHNSTYTVVMRAIDDGEPPATGTGTLLIHLGDKNDNAPRLTTNASILCGNKADRMRLAAADADAFPFSDPFTFTLGEDEQELKNLWKINPSTGPEASLISKTSLPYGTYTVPLKIADQQGVLTHSALKVMVCDCGKGDVCEDLQARSSSLHGVAVGILMAALLLLALLLCFCFLCECREKKNFMPYMQCDGNQTLIEYNDEGMGSICKADPQLLHSPVSSIGTLKTDQKSPINHLVNTRTGSIQLGELSNGIKSPNGSRNYYSMSTSRIRSNRNSTSETIRSGLNRSISLNMEHLLEMKLSKLSQDQQDLPEYHPQDYSSEGPNGSTVSLERLSFHMSGSHLDLVQNLGPSFSTLDNVCRQALKEKNIKL